MIELTIIFSVLANSLTRILHKWKEKQGILGTEVATVLKERIEHRLWGVVVEKGEGEGRESKGGRKRVKEEEKE